MSTSHPNPALTIQIDSLVKAHPPSSILIIGWNPEKAEAVTKLIVSSNAPVIVVESQKRRIQYLESEFCTNSSCHILHGVIAPQSGKIEFHETTIRREDGIWPVENLRKIWPNIREHRSYCCDAISLDQLMKEWANPTNWLWLDSLPAVDILAACPDALEKFDVIGARVVMDDANHSEFSGASLTSLRNLLSKYGLEMIFRESEINPKMGFALFSRNLKLGIEAIPAHVAAAIRETITSEEPTESLSLWMRSPDHPPSERYDFLLGVALHARKNGDLVYASSLLNEMIPLLEQLPVSYMWHLVETILEHGNSEDAYGILANRIADNTPLRPKLESKLRDACKKAHERILGNMGHGHEVLISFVRKHAEQFRIEAAGAKPVLIEIGTTRENTLGQGSTRRIMDLCLELGFHFITVDMDPVNTEAAQAMFDAHGCAFEAIHSKGEDYLHAYQGTISCVFLDAYDFDHGGHNERRQSRYVKYLGSRIDERQCHEMHLECTRAIIPKLSPRGIICIDDTWLDGGKWTAKGTLAVPHLLGNGMVFLDIRNKSALLGNHCWIQ